MFAQVLKWMSPLGFQPALWIPLRLHRGYFKKSHYTQTFGGSPTHLCPVHRGIILGSRLFHPREAIRDRGGEVNLYHYCEIVQSVCKRLSCHSNDISILGLLA